MFSSAPTANDWPSKLQQSIKENHRSTFPENIPIAVASTTPNGNPKIQPIRFCQFHHDPNILLFSASTRNPDIMSILKTSKNHEVYWNMGNDTFVLSGRLYLVAAPTVAFRYGTPPRKVGCEQVNFEEFWEKIRLLAWKNLNKSYRATFSWPISGEIAVPDSKATWKAHGSSSLVRLPSLGIDTGHKYTSLDAMDEPSSDSKQSTSKDELIHVHNSALDSFCLLVFKVSMVDHTINKSGSIPTRYRHVFDNDQWLIHKKLQSTTRSSSAPARRKCYIAIAEGRGTISEIGMASLDLETVSCNLSQFTDTASFSYLITKIHCINPTWVLISSSSVNVTKLYHALAELDIEIVSVNRQFWDDQLGLSLLNRYSLNSIQEVSEKYYCLSAIAALFSHIDVVCNVVFSAKSIAFKYSPIDGTMHIDKNTVRNLELVRNLTNGKDCLFEAMNKTCTKMGERLLRSNILQPLSDETTIMTRLDAVQELIDREQLTGYLYLTLEMKDIPDLDRLISSLIQRPARLVIKKTESAINNIITLKFAIQKVLVLVPIMENCNSVILTACCHTLTDRVVKEILDDINQVINEDTTLQKTPIGLENQRCNAVKAGVNGLLDVARATHREICQDIHQVHQHYREDFQLDIDLKFAQNQGFYLQLSEQEYVAVKSGGQEFEEFKNIQKKGTKIHFTTLKLLKMNERMKESLNEVYIMSDEAIATLLDLIQSKIGVIYKISEMLALVDLVLSFATSCTLSPHVRPEFTDTIAIKNGRHPILDKNEWVCNNTFANNANRLSIITGPNMSGKSCYMNQIALIIIMAHMGSFVPCEYCSVKLIKSVYSRIGRDNSLEANASSYAIEMKETATILNQANSDSLVIIDELGRGTSTEDGLATCIAVCEALLAKKAITYFVSHFTELSNFLGRQPGLVYLQLAVMQENEHLKFRYNVQVGVCDLKHYGINLAKTIGMPTQIIEEAINISNDLDKRAELLKRDNQLNKQQKMDAIYLEFADKIIQFAKHSRLDNESNKKLLTALKNDLIEKLKE